MASENNITSDAKDKLIVALDYSNTKEALEMVKALGDAVAFYKVGLSLIFTNGGEITKLSDELNKLGKKIFVDVKLIDIPQTVANAVRSIASNNATFATIMMLNEKEAATLAIKAKNEVNNTTKILGVTVLTSSTLSHEAAKEETLKKSIIAKEWGLDGVICSALFAKEVKAEVGEGFLIVCPGIREFNDAKNDQKLVSTPEEAIRAGATHLVTGRPITQAKLFMTKAGVLSTQAEASLAKAEEFLEKIRQAG